MNTSETAPGIVCTIWNTIPIPDESYAADWLFTDTDKIVISILLPIIIIVGVIGNACFLFMIARLRRMHTLTNFYLANIAVADIILLIYTPVVYVWSYFNAPIVHYMPIENNAGCFSTGFVSYFGYFASIHIVTLVSLERWLAICRPFQHRSMKGKSRTLKFITSAWMLASMFALMKGTRYGKSIWFCMAWPDSEEYIELPAYLHTCVSMWKELDTYGVTLELVAYLLGLMINGAFYVMIIHTLSNRSMVDVSNPGDQATAIRNQVARLLIINGIVFFICQTPYRVANLNDIVKGFFGNDLLSKSESDSVKIFGRAFLYLNSSVNVFIYAFTSSFYRTGFRDAFSIGSKQMKKQNTMKSVTSGTISSSI